LLVIASYPFSLFQTNMLSVCLFLLVGTNAGGIASYVFLLLDL